MTARSVVLALVALVSSYAYAWSNDGHRITGNIASSQLNDVARARVRELLGDDDLAKIATLMDDDREEFERRHRGSSKWHYENREVCGSPTPSCPQGQCVTRQIEHFTKVLRDKSSSRGERVEALTILVHLIGDLHQPLHLADNHDRGGNDAWVQLPRDRSPRRLHEAWDYAFVHLNMNRRTPSAYARILLKDYSPDIKDWRRGDINSWADDTFLIGRDHSYRKLPAFTCPSRTPAASHSNDDPVRLSQEYIQDSRRIVAEQLAKAGVRIAVVLNGALDR